MNARRLIGLVVLVIVLVLGYLIGYMRGQDVASSNTSDWIEDEAAMTRPGARLDATQSALVGEWQSAADAKFKRSITADHRFSDSYEGDPSATYEDAWSIGPSEDDSYVIVTFGVGAETGKSYRVEKVTPEELVLLPFGDGDRLTFTKVVAAE